jgi:hypothetical protein
MDTAFPAPPAPHAGPADNPFAPRPQWPCGRASASGRPRHETSTSPGAQDGNPRLTGRPPPAATPNPTPLLPQRLHIVGNRRLHQIPAEHLRPVIDEFRHIFLLKPLRAQLPPLARVAEFITKGSTPTTYGFAWQNEGVLFLRSECVSERGLDLAQSMFIAPEAHRLLRRSEVCAQDILMTITGNVGRVVQLDADLGQGNINQHIARIRIADPEVSTPFVLQFLSQPS